MTVPFHDVANVPVQDVVRIGSREEAVGVIRGHVRLRFCHNCGLIWNSAFRPELMNYNAQCEETQAFSPVFHDFQEQMARDLVDRHDLHGKTILEIGCGKGDFLASLCRIGGNRGIGFDPAFVPERNPAGPGEDLSFIQEFYSERYCDYKADFICCKMSLEHIFDPVSLLGCVRRSIEPERNAVVFFQVPDVTRILRDCAFWDIYYEHCNYFGASSLERMFRKCGFVVTRTEKHYGAQYIALEAQATNGDGDRPHIEPDDTGELNGLVWKFTYTYKRALQQWRERVDAYDQAGRKVVLWGGGSKAVGFLSALAMDPAISCIVDINPHKHGTFLPGTGHEIVAPSHLRAVQPALVILMNPVYRREVSAELTSLGLSPELLAV